MPVPYPPPQADRQAHRRAPALGRQFIERGHRGRPAHGGTAAALTLLALTLSTTLPAEPPPADIPRQMQLDQANQQALRDLQSSTDHPWSMPTPDEVHRRELHYRERAMEQQILQESQRRELLILNHRAGAAPPQMTDGRLRQEAMRKQRQFQIEQMEQMNRFRMQQRPSMR